MRKPSQLLIAERAHAARFEIGDVDKADEMHAAGVKRVPAGALRVLAVTFEIGLAVFLVDEIVLARHIMDIELGFADDFLRIVELPWLRKMGDVAGVDHEGGLDRKAVHLIDRFLQGPKRIGIGRLVETYMAIRNLQEAEARGGFFCRLSRAHAEKLRGFGDASSDGPDDAGPGPDHAFERAAPVDPCALLVVRHFRSPWTGALARCYGGDFAARLFIPGALRAPPRDPLRDGGLAIKAGFPPEDMLDPHFQHQGDLMRGSPEQIIERRGACELAAEKIEFLGDPRPLPRRDRLGADARGEVARDERHE